MILLKGNVKYKGDLTDRYAFVFILTFVCSLHKQLWVALVRMNQRLGLFAISSFGSVTSTGNSLEALYFISDLPFNLHLNLYVLKKKKRVVKNKVQ